MYRLSCHVQNYPWGKPAEESLVADFQAANEEDQPIVERNRGRPFAELWMGTHTNGPSNVILEDGSKITLGEWLKEHGSKSENSLPFMFKVLSVDRALSIQAHPDKELAAKLHHNYPDIYKDPNHKPELACALGKFEALCGFRPKVDIVHEFERTPELLELVSEDSFEAFRSCVDYDDTGNFKNAARVLFEEYISSEGASLREVIERLVNRLNSADGNKLSTSDHIALRLHQDFPFDIGIFAPYWLNYLQLEAGQSFFMAPNEPHAYLKGDCVECMACSDNVVRAGLTGKYKDVKTLCSMLTYKMHDIAVSAGQRVDNTKVKYQPPVSEFILYRIHLAPHQTGTTVKAVEPSICLVIYGSGATPARSLYRGQTYVVEGGYECSIESGASGLSLFQIFSPDSSEA